MILVVTGFLMHGWIDGESNECNRLKGVQFVCGNPIISRAICFPLIRGNLGSKMDLIRKHATINFVSWILGTNRISIK